MRKFLEEDLVAKYENTDFKKIPGKSPEMVFLNDSGEELERLDIAKLTRDELNRLLVSKGIKQKPSPRDEV